MGNSDVVDEMPVWAALRVGGAAGKAYQAFT
jgi:hypothetical protein